MRIKQFIIFIICLIGFPAKAFSIVDSTLLPYSIVVKGGVEEKYLEWLNKIKDIEERLHFFKLDSMVNPDLPISLEGICVELNMYTFFPDDTSRFEFAKDMPHGNFFMATLEHDSSLSLRIAAPFSDYYVVHNVRQKMARSYWEIYFKSDKVVKAKQEDTFTSRLLVPAQTIRMVLSDSVFKAGQILYGYVQMETAPYYNAQDGATTKMKHYIEYFFKAIVIDDNFARNAREKRLEYYRKNHIE